MLARASFPRRLRSRPIPGLVAAELIPRSRSMHERFDQRCEIPKSLRGRVRAFDVHAGKGRLGGLGSGRAGGGGGGGRRTRASVVGAGLAMRTCQEQRLACPLSSRALTRLPGCSHFTWFAHSRVVRACPVCWYSRRVARVTCNRSLFLIWFSSKSKTDRAAIYSTGKFVTASSFPSCIVGKRLLRKHFRLLWREYEGELVAREINNDPSLMAIDISL